MLAATMSKKTVQKIIKPAALKVIALQAAAETLRKIVDARHAAILAAKEYKTADGERVTEPKHDWLICDEQSREYFDAIDKANRDAGFTGPFDHCPALIAETELRDAQRELTDVAGPLFGITFDQIMTSANCLEKYAEFIRLICGLALCKIR